MEGCTDTACTEEVVAHRVENIISEPGILSVEVSVWLLIRAFRVRVSAFASFELRSLLN